MGKSSTEINFKTAFDAATEAVQAGRASLLSYFGKIHMIESKEKAGLVSEADRETEKLMKRILAEKCPEIDFLGEETSYSDGDKELKASSRPRWILDPLDGTTNYIHQLPIFCISLALELNGEVLIGIIDIPMMNQTLTAIRGEGAFCNGKRIQISKCDTLEKAFMTTGFVNEEPEILKEQLKIFNHFVWKANAIRRPGAAAYDLAMVAMGVFDLYWEKNIKPWDVAAGILLVNEAGGVCRNYQNGVYDPFQKSIVAGGPQTVELFNRDLSQVLHPR